MLFFNNEGDNNIMSLSILRKSTYPSLEEIDISKNEKMQIRTSS